MVWGSRFALGTRCTLKLASYAEAAAKQVKGLPPRDALGDSSVTGWRLSYLRFLQP